MTNFLSERLDHRPMTEEDWPFFLALNQDPQVVRYVADDRSEAAIRLLFDVRLPRWEVGSPHWLCWVIRERSTGERVGVTGLIDRGEGVAEVGFLLASAFHGKGYGIESLRLLCRFAFAEARFRKLSATVTVGNAASKAVLEKAGFVLEARFEKTLFKNGEYLDELVYATRRPADVP